MAMITVAGFGALLVVISLCLSKITQIFGGFIPLPLRDILIRRALGIFLTRILISQGPAH